MRGSKARWDWRCHTEHQGRTQRHYDTSPAFVISDRIRWKAKLKNAAHPYPTTRIIGFIASLLLRGWVDDSNPASTTLDHELIVDWSCRLAHRNA
ncbi:MAG: hypothetical protein Q9228_004974 [Teloschistes exilis]